MSKRLLDCNNVVKIRRAVALQDVDALRSVEFGGISIGAIIELCCAKHQWRTEDSRCGLEIFQRLALRFPALTSCWSHLDRVINDSRSQFPIYSGNFAVCGIGQKQAFTDRRWSEFQQVFVNRLKLSGFDAGFACALSAAFGEIAENVPDHSNYGETEMAPALIGYFVLPGEVHFAVGDTGRGVLSSLRENPRWSGLVNSRDAILETLEHAATRKQEHPEGGGLKLAMKSFVDRNGILTMSSGDATAHVSRDSKGRHTIYAVAPAVAGTCVSASCFSRGMPEEKSIPENII
jgi:hypothetical protein